MCPETCAPKVARIFEKDQFFRSSKKGQFMHSLNHKGSFIKYCLKNLIKLIELRTDNSVQITGTFDNKYSNYFCLK